MKTDIQTSNETTTPNSHELNILKKYFPQCFSKPDTDENGNIIKEHFDVEKLTELLNKDEVDIKKEGFTLNFLGKSYAHYQSNLDSETVIVPDEKNAESDSENVYIVGDNLDALQHLKYSYAERIKCIYIDPPYNTGKDDFVYNDKFGFTAKELVEKLDVSEEEAERICSMNGKCTHSAWLTFMYPRLALARELLRDDGVIFISIDDNEQANLKRLCDEVFGEGNFEGHIHWRRRHNQPNDKTKMLGLVAEHILVYAKNSFAYKNAGVGKVAVTADFSNPDNDPKGPWASKPWKVGSDQSGSRYKITTPKGIILDEEWMGDEKTYNDFLKEGRIYFPKNGDGMPRKKYYQFEREEEGQCATNWWNHEQFGHNQGGNDEMTLLFNQQKNIFSNPKPTKLIKNILNVSNANKDCIVLDFFSGSASTADAVLQLNAEEEKYGNKKLIKYIMVQLDEPVKKDSEAEKAGYKTIDEIGRERIRRAAAKIKAEHPDTTADLGFKTYYLKSMPKETLDKIKTFDPNALISSDGNIVKSLGEQTLLQTWQIKDGFGFNAVPQKIDLSGFTAYLLDDEEIGKYLYLLGEIEEKSIKELIRKIESLELTVDKIFIYGYSFDFNMLTSITTNLKTLKNRNPLEPIVRY